MIRNVCRSKSKKKNLLYRMKSIQSCCYCHVSYSVSCTASPPFTKSPPTASWDSKVPIKYALWNIIRIGKSGLFLHTVLSLPTVLWILKILTYYSFHLLFLTYYSYIYRCTFDKIWYCMWKNIPNIVIYAVHTHTYMEIYIFYI